MWSINSASLIIMGAAGAVSPIKNCLKKCLVGGAAGTLLALAPFGLAGVMDVRPAFAQQDNLQAPPPDDAQDEAGADDAVADDAGVDDAGAEPADDASAESPFDNPDIEPLSPGEAVVTRFSHTMEGVDDKGKPLTIIDVNGISASIVDIRTPGEPPVGQHWLNEPQRMFVTAAEVGQVFGVTIANRDGAAPDIFLTATSAYGLHRLDAGNGKSEWMAGQWGPDAGPGTIYRISEETGYRAEKFADVRLDGRDNSGAALGNIAYDKAHGRLFVSDLETGMIHSIDAATGKDTGRYDHGTMGRTDFLDVWTAQQRALDPIAFDPTSSAAIDTCSGDFAATPACWNIADFRRRVWGLKVRTDEAGDVRLYYSVWGSEALGNADWARAGDDRRNAVWSVAITEGGLFDTTSVRREFFLPAFWASQPSLGDKAGNSNAVSDITFPQCVPENVMLVAERGAQRNLGLDAVEPFARPYESRVVRYELGADSIWRPKGRYDVGFHDRSLKEGDPLLFANAAGGVDFNYRIGENGSLDMATPSQSVWMTGDGLCSPLGGCTDKDKGAGADISEVHGLQGTPADAFAAVEPEAKPSQDALLRSLMIDADINVDESGIAVASELSRNDATKIGDVAIYQVCEAAAPLPIIDVPGEERTEEEILPPVEPPEVLPVHTVNMSHAKWASSGHRVRQSWHWREGSWHQSDRSWHWREGSWHSANRSWHWRGGSWHDSNRSWHRRNGSWHDRARSWHLKTRSWDDGHRKGRSYHNRLRSNDDGHVKGRSVHNRARSWDDGHAKGRSYHVKSRTWDANHVKGRSRHVTGRTYADDGRPTHDKRHSVHVKGRTWGGDANPTHSKRKSQAVDDKPKHLRSRSRGDEAVPQHSRRRSNAANEDGKPKHLRSRSRGDEAVPQHSRRRSNAANEDGKPKHLRSRSRGDDSVQQHSRRRSNAANEDGKPKHLRSRSRGDDGVQQHSRRRSNASADDNKPEHLRRQSRGDDGGQQQRHGRRRSLQENGG